MSYTYNNCIRLYETSYIICLLTHIWVMEDRILSYTNISSFLKEIRQTNQQQKQLPFELIVFDCNFLKTNKILYIINFT